MIDSTHVDCSKIISVEGEGRPDLYTFEPRDKEPNKYGSNPGSWNKVTHLILPLPP